MGLLDGKVAIVTGAGRGVGRGHALELARQGASVVVNDLGGEWDGSGTDNRPASEVVAEIEALGGKGAANFDNVATWDGASWQRNSGFLQRRSMWFTAPGSLMR
jgi:NAD(P)-dependent dehydrogenase (short-subunit alcohol dehydrogenase family)